MEKEQVQEWANAQMIVMSIDLVEAAKTHLQFLVAVDENRFLFDDDVLQRAVYRYKAFWLPLLAKHSENPLTKESLVVPLDCELIWHCHRLNPLRYKFDCENLYGKILSNDKVMSSVQATSKIATEELWNKMYPDEHYELDLQKPFSRDLVDINSENKKFVTYDLIAAVKRQMSFTEKALSKLHISDDLFLKEAVNRYKGFLHIFRTNTKTGLNRFLVPTYDIDLIWHTHQLHPIVYYEDMNDLVGFVVQHSDTDVDNSKWSRVDTGFRETAKQWKQMYGSSGYQTAEGVDGSEVVRAFCEINCIIIKCCSGRFDEDIPMLAPAIPNHPVAT